MRKIMKNAKLLVGSHYWTFDEYTFNVIFPQLSRHTHTLRHWQTRTLGICRNKAQKYTCTHHVQIKYFPAAISNKIQKYFLNERRRQLYSVVRMHTLILCRALFFFVARLFRFNFSLFAENVLLFFFFFFFKVMKLVQFYKICWLLVLLLPAAVVVGKFPCPMCCTQTHT